jgi:hypothetical protein
MCNDFSLWLAIKARAWKGVDQKCSLGVTFTLPRMWENVREWAHTFPSGFTLWKLETQWTFKSSNSNLKVQNSLDWKLPYIIINILRLRCLKCVCMIHLSTSNTSYGQKKGWESKCQFDPSPLKIRNHLKLRACRRSVIYHWRAFNNGYNFAIDLISIRGFHKKLLVSKVVEIIISRIIGLLTWESREKCHLNVAFMVCHKEYYKRENCDFP